MNFKKLDYDFTLIFGKKGSGKTSFLAKCAKKYSERGFTVLCTERDIANTYYYPANLVGTQWIKDNSVLLIDELSLCYNSRDFRSLSKDTRNWFKYSRHNRVKVIAFTQHWDDSDKQIRQLADKMYLAQNMGYFATYRRIRPVTGIKTNSDGVGCIVDSFEYSPLLRRGALMFCSLSKYRNLFNSYSRLDLPDMDLSTLDYTLAPDVPTYKQRVSAMIERYRKKPCEISEIE